MINEAKLKKLVGRYSPIVEDLTEEWISADPLLDLLKVIALYDECANQIVDAERKRIQEIHRAFCWKYAPKAIIRSKFEKSLCAVCNSRTVLKGDEIYYAGEAGAIHTTPQMCIKRLSESEIHLDKLMVQVLELMNER